MFAADFRRTAAHRRARFLTIALALMAFLFAQSALAAYACPGIAAALEVAQMVEAGAPCAESMSRAMDDDQPALCHTHCQSSQGAVDHLQPTQSGHFSHAGPVLTVALPAAARTSPINRQPARFRVSAGPPIAIANCCFRI